MSSPISPITAPALLETPSATAAAVRQTQPATTSFEDVLGAAIQHVEASRDGADAAAKDFLAGGNQELHSVILAGQNASLDFEMLMQVRNRVVSAYEEIMRMQI